MLAFFAFAGISLPSHTKRRFLEEQVPIGGGKPAPPSNRFSLRSKQIQDWSHFLRGVGGKQVSIAGLFRFAEREREEQAEGAILQPISGSRDSGRGLSAWKAEPETRGRNGGPPSSPARERHRTDCCRWQARRTRVSQEPRSGKRFSLQTNDTPQTAGVQSLLPPPPVEWGGREGRKNALAGAMSHVFSKGEPAQGVGLMQELGRREEVKCDCSGQESLHRKTKQHLSPAGQPVLWSGGSKLPSVCSPCKVLWKGGPAGAATQEGTSHETRAPSAAALQWGLLLKRDSDPWDTGKQKSTRPQQLCRIFQAALSAEGPPSLQSLLPPPKALPLWGPPQVKRMPVGPYNHPTRKCICKAGG